MNSINEFMSRDWPEMNLFEMETGPEQPEEIEFEVPENEISETEEDGDESHKITFS